MNDFCFLFPFNFAQLKNQKKLKSKKNGYSKTKCKNRKLKENQWYNNMFKYGRHEFISTFSTLTKENLAQKKARSL